MFERKSVGRFSEFVKKSIVIAFAKNFSVVWECCEYKELILKFGNSALD